MILSKIYTFPTKLFGEVVFKPGLNIIYAHQPEHKKEEIVKEGSKTSLHAVGKSTLLDLILFALLYDSKSFHRINNAIDKKILTGLSVVLEFSINKKNYYVKRSFDNPNRKIYFGPLNKGDSYTVGKLREKLYKLIFDRSEYSGITNSNWYQKLLTFYIKDKRREDIFIDPIQFSHNMSELEVTPFHLFLMNIDNSVAYEHMTSLEQIQKLESFLTQQENSVKERMNTKDLTSLQNERQKFKNKIIRLERTIKEFSLTDNYKELEDHADELTTEIKKLWFSNAIYRKKLQTLSEYEKAMPAEVYENIENIAEIYNEVNELLANNINKTLQDAIDFRKDLHSSRKEFIGTEKGRLNSEILLQNQKIANLENERKQLLDELSNLSALDDLTNAYTHLAQVQQKLSDIESSLKSIDDTKEQIKEKRNEYEIILEQITSYLDSINSDVQDFREIMEFIYNQIIIDSHNVTIFSVDETEQKQKIKISVLEGSITDSTGINQIRTLIYDMAVLLNISKQNLNAPRFIVHDGIFENLHQSHFFAFMSFVDELMAKDDNFQYILTLNEHDFFDEVEDFKKEKILRNTIIRLTPGKPLLSIEF